MKPLRGSSKIKLESIIFYVKDWSSLINSSSVPIILDTNLPQNPKNQPEQPLNHQLLSRLPSSEGPLWSQQTTSGAYALHLLAESVQYQFSDQITLNAAEILSHEYFHIIRTELLPHPRDVRSDVLRYPWLSLLPHPLFPYWGPIRNSELALISVLLNAALFKIAERPGAPRFLWMTNEPNPSKKRLAYELKNIRIETIPQLSWQLSPPSIGNIEKTNLIQEGEAKLIFSTDLKNKNLIYFKNFYLDQSSRTLYFHSYQRQIILVNHILYDYTKKNLHPTHDLTSSFLLSGHENISNNIKFINKKLKKYHFPSIKKPQTDSIPSDAVKTQIWIEPNGVFKFCHLIQSKAEYIKIWNLPKTVLKCIQGFELGFTSIFQEKEIKAITEARKTTRKERDIKIIKHGGVYAYFLMNVIKLSANYHSFDSFFKIILSQLGKLLYEIEKNTGHTSFPSILPLDQLCSIHLIELIKKHTIDLLELIQGEKRIDSESLFLNSGELQILGTTHIALTHIQCILQTMSQYSKEQCFYKSHFDYLSASSKKNSQLLERITQHCTLTLEEPYQGVQNYKISIDTSLLKFIIQKFLYLDNTEVFYKKLPLQVMDLSEFKPKWSILETPRLIHENQIAIDWFELHPQFFFKGEEIQINSIEQMTQEGILEFQGKIFFIENKNLPNLKKLEIFWSKINQQKNQLENKKSHRKNTYLLPRNQVLELLSLRASGFEFQGGPQWEKICNFYDSLNKKRDFFTLPKSFKTNLKTYQAQGVQWILDLYQLGLGGILADDMGLGKTIQTLAFLEILRKKDEMGITLIIVPTSLTFNWQSEIKKFTPEIPIQIFNSKIKFKTIEFTKQNPNCIIICTYGLFTEHEDFFSKNKWDILVFDEAQNLKNLTAKRTTASRVVSSRFKLCLTGTPMENHLLEFYSLIDLVVPGCLGDIATFRDQYVKPEIISTQMIEELKLKIKPLVLRRTKSEILKELPPKIETVVKLPFEKKQEKIYRDIALSWNQKVKRSILEQGESKSQILMLTALLRLRQTCSDPSAIPHVKYHEEPPKITVLMEALREITESGESAIVFTQFLKTFFHIEKKLNQGKINFFSLHGATPRIEREKILNNFYNTPLGCVLLMTLKTGGVGLNLIKASYVFHIEPWWNPAVENQASDRVHRMGQNKPVQVYRYLMKESVEEKIEILKLRKSEKFNALFKENNASKELKTKENFLTQEDFEYLIR